MKLRCLATGSSGNCYILENAKEALVIEAGVPFMEVKKSLDFNVRKIVGVVVSHSHEDHAKYIAEYEKAGIPVFKPYEDFSRIKLWGNFGIRPFELVHDVCCYGFYIKHRDMGSAIYASDTEYIRYRFKGLNHIFVECNYDKNLVREDAVNRSHVLTGHMELQTTKEFLRVNTNPGLNNVVLLHMSRNNADPVEFASEISKMVSCPVWVAQSGLEIDLRLMPF